MTIIRRDVLIENMENCQPNLLARNFASCPKEVKSYIGKNEYIEFNEDYSIVLYDKNSNNVYAYILTRQANIPHINECFNDQQWVIEFLENATGLYIIKAVIQNGLDNEYLVALLNSLHLTYCHADLNDKRLYIWINNGEIIFSPTMQDEAFNNALLNRVGKVFYPYLYKTNLTERTIL